MSDSASATPLFYGAEHRVAGRRLRVRRRGDVATRPDASGRVRARHHGCSAFAFVRAHDRRLRDEHALAAMGNALRLDGADASLHRHRPVADTARRCDRARTGRGRDRVVGAPRRRRRCVRVARRRASTPVRARLRFRHFGPARVAGARRVVRRTRRFRLRVRRRRQDDHGERARLAQRHARQVRGARQFRDALLRRGVLVGGGHRRPAPGRSDRVCVRGGDFGPARAGLDPPGEADHVVRGAAGARRRGRGRGGGARRHRRVGGCRDPGRRRRVRRDAARGPERACRPLSLPWVSARSRWRSRRGRRRRRSTSVVGWSLVVDVLASTVSGLGWIDHVSLLHYMALAPAQRVSATTVVVTLGVALALGIGATAVFRRRDILSR